MDIKQARRLAEDVEKSQPMQMAQRRDYVKLMRAHSAIDRSKHMVAMEIKRQQKIVHRSFQLKLHQSKLRHARMIGDRQLEKKLRLEKETILNTNLSRDSQDDVLRHIWNCGERQMAWANKTLDGQSGIDSRCISAVQSENRKSRILFPVEKSVLFSRTPVDVSNSKKKPRPLSTVSIAQPERMPVRPATAYELSAIKKALSLGDSEVHITTTSRAKPSVYVTKPDDDEDDNDDAGKIENVYGGFSELFKPKKDRSSGSGVGEKRNQPTEFDDNDCDGKQDRVLLGEFSEDGTAHVKWTNTSGKHGYKCSHGDRDKNSIQGQRRKQKHVQIRHNNFLQFKRPETAPDNFMYVHKENDTFYEQENTDKPKFAIKKSLSNYSGLTRSRSLSRSRSPKKVSLFNKEEGPSLLDIHRQEVELADYDGKVREFSRKLIPLKAGENNITDYYVSRLMEKKSRGGNQAACALRFISRSPEIEGARISKLSKIPNLTFKTVNLNFRSHNSSPASIIDQYLY